jgi:hypothetical protein
MLLLVAACSGPVVPATTPAPSPSREPAGLAVLPAERAVLDAFGAGGLTIRTVGGSKAEGLLGQVLPARVFIVTSGPVAGGFGQGADVLFLPPRFGTIEVCSRPGAAPGRTIYTLFVDGRKTSDADSAAPVYYLVGTEYFVIAYDPRARDALEHGLGLKPANQPQLCA